MLSDVLILGVTAGSICAEIGGFGLAPVPWEREKDWESKREAGGQFQKLQGNEFLEKPLEMVG